MTDPRAIKLAELLVNYSCTVKPGDNVLIEAYDIPNMFTKALVNAVGKAGGRPVPGDATRPDCVR